jgi:hypothetical protein
MLVPKVLEMEKRLGISRGDLLRVMFLESGGRLDAKNKHTGAVGLIQFMPATLRAMGVTEWRGDDLDFQLALVERYLRPYVGRMNGLANTYAAVFFPVACGKCSDPEYVVTGSPWVVKVNGVLDENGDGKITAGELEAAVRRACRGPEWGRIAREAGLGSGDALQDWGTVAGLQRALGVPADGIVGPVTRGAIRAYEKKQGWKVTGEPSVGLFKALGVTAK